MKEQFRNWKPRKDIRVKYYLNPAKTEWKYWETDTETLLSQMNNVVDHFMKIDIKLTNRQLYYRLVAVYSIPNFMKVYKRVCKFLTDVRYAGLIDWDAIEDRDRVPTKHSEWDDVNSLVYSAVRAYRLPRWRDQEHYVELYCEKKAGQSTLKPIADKYHMYFGYNKGYSSASTMYDLAKRIKEQIEDNKKAIILYFGDHDASGLDMVRDIRDRIEEFLTEGEDYTEPDFEIINVALTTEQVKEYNPPPDPAKKTDPRYKWYVQKYGTQSWELDALDPLELRKIAEEAILEYLDVDKYNAIVKQEEEEIEALKKFGKELSEKGDE